MSNQMSREQAALNMLHLLNMDEGRAWNNKHFTPCEKQSIEMAIAALRGPQPDPDTGLVPCGCGERVSISFYPGRAGTPDLYQVDCFSCHVGIRPCQTAEQAKAAWNTAMGWKGGAE